MEEKRVSLSRAELIKLKVKARRRGVWFKVLSRIERSLLDLAIKVVEKVHSLVLAKSLTSVVEKLLDSMESEITVLMRSAGCSLARKISEIAQGWGNKSARSWASDLSFIQFLAIMKKNLSPVFAV